MMELHKRVERAKAARGAEAESLGCSSPSSVNYSRPAPKSTPPSPPHSIAGSELFTSDLPSQDLWTPSRIEKKSSRFGTSVAEESKAAFPKSTPKKRPPGGDNDDDIKMTPKPKLSFAASRRKRMAKRRPDVRKTADSSALKNIEAGFQAQFLGKLKGARRGKHTRRTPSKVTVDPLDSDFDF